MELKTRIEKAVSEARELSERWTGTLHEELIMRDMNTLLDRIAEPKHESCFSLLESLENTITKARDELERSENEG